MGEPGYSRNRVSELVRSITASLLLVSPESIRTDALLRDELGLDSADIAELIVSLEEQLKIPLPDKPFNSDNGADPLRSVESLVDLLVRLLEEENHVQKGSS
jgi:acyl carrier protein